VLRQDTSSSRHQAFTATVLLLAFLMVVAGAGIALAGTYTYKTGSAPLGYFSNSGIANITGGRIDTSCPMCTVDIRTTLSWSPYYPIVVGGGYGSAWMSHGVQSQSRSRCLAAYGDVPGSTDKTCKYYY
jgi:hypothetical protein